MSNLNWKKYPVLNDGFICLVDHMGTDASICQAARVSYGNDDRTLNHTHETTLAGKQPDHTENKKDAELIRLLLRHGHTTPFEMVEIKFLVRVPMDCWRQWIRHRTANVNEYSTRYREAIDSQQTTHPEEWRLQATNNKQGSSGFLSNWESLALEEDSSMHLKYKESIECGENPGEHLSIEEKDFHHRACRLYQERLSFGIAKEQARKDLPLSTYTEAYWKCDLHNIFNFLRLRMDSHAQLEIRLYANAMAEIVKQLFPIAWQAFEDYQLNSMKLTAKDIEAIKELRTHAGEACKFIDGLPKYFYDVFTNKREREECVAKLTKLGIL